MAIPTKDDRVDNHFGHCEVYTVYRVENNEIVGTESVPSPQGCGCKSNIIPELKARGVEVMLAGNMGNGAVNKLQNCGIKVVRGCEGTVKDVAEAYLSDKLIDSGLGCEHTHEAGHECSH
ncbi:NifB/NifX family molybdenum-iron cluster-binding protein [Carboxylicivirga sp. RSCT41]|uniref:NifB/NifX family molybdenum-iron cluster-binding protein n=1 Tax=Carboxylicivirga agarovorans TaxID=3417570 RepID=UPI003D330075